MEALRRGQFEVLPTFGAETRLSQKDCQIESFDEAKPLTGFAARLKRDIYERNFRLSAINHEREMKSSSFP
jgi:hypothetical protein